MKKFFHYVFVRQRHNWRQLFRFGAVGGSGAVVNMIVIVLCKKAFPDYMAIAAPLPIGDFNIRWYHVFLMIGFIVSNLWNFQINRLWTFKSGKHAGWWREYAPFLTVGLVAVAVGQGLLTLMLNHSSPLRLTNFFPVLDDSTGSSKSIKSRVSPVASRIATSTSPEQVFDGTRLASTGSLRVHP